MLLCWTVVLVVAAVSRAAKPDPPNRDAGITTVGSQKLATASDCSKPVAFSGTHFNVQDGRLILPRTLLDQGVGYSGSTGIFTTHCPGLYQFSFSGSGNGSLRMTLKQKSAKISDDGWQSIASIPSNGGSQLVLLRMMLGDQVAVFVESGKSDDLATSFSGYRIAKE